MYYPVTKVCLTCHKKLPLAAFEATGGRNRPGGGGVYYRHDCRECRKFPYKSLGFLRHEPPPPPKPEGECIIRGCHEHVTDADETHVLCALHFRQYRPLCRCGCGREIEMDEREGYRLTCWRRRSPAGMRNAREYQRIRMAMKRKERADALKYAAMKRAARRAAEVRAMPISTSATSSPPCPDPACSSGSAITPSMVTGQCEEDVMGATHDEP